MKRILPASFDTPLTLFGSFIALFNLGLIVFLLIVDLLAKRPKPYSDLIILLVLPLFILIGVAFIILGIVRQRRRQKLAGEEQGLLVIDFNDQKQRRRVILLSLGFLFFTLLYAFGMHQGYEFVESDFFCTRICHSVMGPVARAHSFSSHEEVGCSACHVGSGTKYFVLSKLQGTRALHLL
jgi:hypothetical protein